MIFVPKRMIHGLGGKQIQTSFKQGHQKSWNDSFEESQPPVTKSVVNKPG